MLNRIEKLILKEEKHPDLVMKELQDQTGLSPRTLRRYRKERACKIDARAAMVIAAYFGVTISELFEPFKNNMKHEKTDA